MVGIHGIGGIGKTTLARVVYNSIVDKFDGSCYLEDVRGNPEKQGLIHLQNILFSKIFGDDKIVVTSVNEGIKVLQVRLKQKKVLLLLDNVDKLDQLRTIVGEPGWFGCGSRVIITTRDTQVLRSHGVERTYEVKELNKKDAYDYLRWKTLKSKEVRPSHDAVFNRALTYTGGHPLAIEIMGSYLFSNKEEEWNSVLDRYKSIPRKEIFENLKVSFDGLDQEEKDVFLDIACFFKGDNLEEVEKILHAHYGREKKDLIKVLIGKSLIKISESNVLTLHDELEDMGKKIVRLESPDHPGERSRLWSIYDIAEVLEGNTGTSKIGGIMMRPDSYYMIDVNWDGEAFKNMTKLRTLVIKGVYFSESPKHLPNSLRVLEWWDYPSEYFPVDFYPKQLTICKLLFSDFYQEDFFKKYFKNMTSLKFISCKSLRSIPDMSGLQNLKDFTCWWCNALITIDDSIGMLGKLQILNVEYCGMLQTIPSLKLPSLEELNLKGLFRIESLSPMLDESMDKLKILRVHNCPKIKTIPPLKLASLEKLYISELHSIKSLSHMLDESLDKLKTLEVYRCSQIIYIQPLKLPSLEELNLSDLRSIKSLSPMLAESLDKLKILNVFWCSDLIYIPLLKLPSLEELDLSYLHSIKSFSPMLNESLDKLKILKVKRCKHLIYIPLLKLPSLEELELSYLDSIASLSPMLDESLDKLKILRVDCCAKLQGIPSLKLASLEELHLSKLHSIKSLSPMLDGSLDQLKFLRVHNCPNIETIPPLKLASLEELRLKGLSSIESLSATLDESLDKLKILKVVDCEKLKTISSLKLASLENVALSELYSIKSLSPLLDESLDKLKVLSIRDCFELCIFPSVMLPSLEILDLSYCDCLESFPRITSWSMAKLKILRLEGCEKLRNIPAVNWDSLDEFDHSGCESLEFSTSD